ncbi:MAG: glycosyltransferase [Candidatus Heimdallarchaeaceae archaeon]
MISIIIPLYNESENVSFLYAELIKVISSLPPCEIIFVDDGSTDDTLSKLLLLPPPNGHSLKIISFTSHRGKSAALQAGFTMAFEDLIITLDGDGQDDPQDIPKMLNTLIDHIDVVTGWRSQRHDRFISKQLPSKIYNALIRFFFKVPFHDNNCPFRIYRKNVVHDIFLFGNYHRFILPILYNKGYKIQEIRVNHRNRLGGKSKYRLTRILTGFLDLIKINIALKIKNLSPFNRFMCVAIMTFVTITLLSISAVSIISKNNSLACFSSIMTFFSMITDLLFISSYLLASKMNKKNIKRNLQLKFYRNVDLRVH